MSLFTQEFFFLPHLLFAAGGNKLALLAMLIKLFL